MRHNIIDRFTYSGFRPLASSPGLLGSSALGPTNHHFCPAAQLESESHWHAEGEAIYKLRQTSARRSIHQPRLATTRNGPISDTVKNRLRQNPVRVRQWLVVSLIPRLTKSAAADSTAVSIGLPTEPRLLGTMNF